MVFTWHIWRVSRRLGCSKPFKLVFILWCRKETQPCHLFCSSPCIAVLEECLEASHFQLKSSCAGLCRRRGWIDPSYECYRRGSGFTCWVVVNGREYLTDVEYESDGLAQENAAMRAFMVCRSFSVNGGMLARNGVVQGVPAREDRSRHRR